MTNDPPGRSARATRRERAVRLLVEALSMCVGVSG
jgi:hypothetical protein